MILTFEIVYSTGASSFFENIATRKRSLEESINIVLLKNKLIEVPTKLAKIFIKVFNAETKELIKEIHCSRNAKVQKSFNVSEERNNFLVKEDIRISK